MSFAALLVEALATAAMLGAGVPVTATSAEEKAGPPPSPPALRGGAVPPPVSPRQPNESSPVLHENSPVLRRAASVTPAPEDPSLEPCDTGVGCWGGEQGEESTYVKSMWVNHPNIYWRCSNPGHIALTFDDGPFAVGTEAVIAELARLEVVATFFVVGLLVEESPGLRSLLTRAEANGHVVAHHSYSHPSLLGKAQKDRAGQWTSDTIKFFDEEISKTINVTKDLLPRAGLRPFLRPPYTEMDESVATLLGERYGLSVVQITIDTKDYEKTATKGFISDRLVKNLSPNVSTHSYIGLQHDTIPVTAEAIEGMVKGGQALGYKFVGMDECLGLPRLLEPNFSWVPPPPEPDCSGEPCPIAGECRSEFGFCGVGEGFCTVKAKWTAACGNTGSKTKTESSKEEPAISSRTLLIASVTIAVLLFLPLLLLLMRKRGRRFGV